MTGSRLELEGAFNFRDLGGLPVPGGRRVASGRVYRSDRLSGLSGADVTVLEGLGIRRVFDLRSDVELAVDGIGEFAAARDRHRHVPLVRVAMHPLDPATDWSGVDLSRRYMQMLEEGAAVVRTVLEEIAAADTGATVFHCTGGKDRTGVVAAVLLRCLGVDDDAVIDDYAVSERHLAPFVEASRERLEAGGVDPTVVLYLCGSPPERMRRLIVDMDARWGSVEGYLDEIGVRESIRESLRRRLLE